MKKMLTFAPIFGVALLACGQGFISFSGGATSATRVSTNGVAVGGATFPIWYYALFAAPSSTSNGTNANTTLDLTRVGWTVVAYGTNTSSAGRFNGNTTTDSAVQIPGYTQGRVADFAVAGWSANIGTDWASVQRQFGNSPVFTDATLDPRLVAPFWYGLAPLTADNVPLQPAGGPYNGVFGTATGLIQGWSLSLFVPEPSTPALVAVAVAAVMTFRRLRRR